MVKAVRCIKGFVAAILAGTTVWCIADWGHDPSQGMASTGTGRGPREPRKPREQLSYYLRQKREMPKSVVNEVLWEDNSRGTAVMATSKRPARDDITRVLFITDAPTVVKGLKSWKEAGTTRTQQELEDKTAGFTRHAFNQYASDRLGYFREIPDTRHPLCREQRYPPPGDLPNTSVIICFHNEALSALLRTVHSVLQRSPWQLLHEIILVDDASTFEDLQLPLDQYVAAHLPVVKVVRATRREGLIRARLLGTHIATGQVLTFLDSHCEVNEGWLVPLLTLLKKNPREAVTPVIDIIQKDSLEYSWVGLNKGGFDWGLAFKWLPLKEHLWRDKLRNVKPFKSPAMAGGLFSIYREYFTSIGSYDNGMDVWGGENVEISLRLWMCGAGIEIVPCSRVGHIFRGYRPYYSPGGDAMGRNVVRVAEVWLDEYKELVYQNHPAYRSYKYGNISSRLLLRKQLRCRPFSWFIEQVYPDLPVPADLHITKATSKKTDSTKGQFKHIASGLCLQLDDVTTKDSQPSSVSMRSCDASVHQQVWCYTHRKLMYSNWCLSLEDTITARVCTNVSWLSPQQLWQYEGVATGYGTLHHNTKCLSVDGRLLSVTTQCSETDYWAFVT